MPVRRALATAALTIAAAACGTGEPVDRATPAGERVAPTVARPATLDLSEVAFVDRTGATAVAVDVRDNRFDQPYLVVDAGTTVTFTNRGSRHDVVPVSAAAFARIDVEALGRGRPVAVTLVEPGDHVYYCSIHGTPRKGMVGAIRVVG